MKGRLFLIPSTLGEVDPKSVLPASVFSVLPLIHDYVVEEVRTVRRFLSAAGLKGQIDSLSFHELNEHTDIATIESYIALFNSGNDVGLISEARLPAVADPGAQLVMLAHKNGIEVVPFVGPSSLMLALMSSGLNGQSFAFTGYLPVKPDARRAELKRLDALSARSGQTQIIIETPYRNDSLFADMLAVCSGNTSICVAADITLPSQFIRTLSVNEWKTNGLLIGKRPCVFVLSASSR